ncbi:unnamed protein product [Peronospora effusa]|nr:unnamed protein product [Peronospora effusa]
MKEVKDAHQAMNNKSLRTKKTLNKTKLMETKLEAVETQDVVVGETVAIDVKPAAEDAEDVQELTELDINQLQSIEVEVVAMRTAKIDRVEAMSAEIKNVETEDTSGLDAVVVEAVESATEDAVCLEFSDRGAVAATAERTATDEETVVSDNVKKDWSADVAATIISTEVVVTNDSDSLDADKEGVLNERLATLVTDEEPADERVVVETCEEVTFVVETDAIKAVAEEGDTETTTWEAIESECLDEAKPVTQDMNLSVEGLATGLIVEEVVVDAVADSEADDEAIPPELEVSAEGDSEIVAEEVTKGEASLVDEEVEEATAAVQKQEVAGKETEVSDIEVDVVMESSITTETKVKTEEVSVVDNDEAARLQMETETAPIDEDAEVYVKETETDIAPFDEDPEVVVSAVETVAVAPSAETDEAIVDETMTFSNTKIAEVGVREADTEMVSVTETNEVQLEKSADVEAAAVDDDLATEKVVETEKSVNKNPAVATVQTASAIAKVSDDEATPAKQTPALKVSSAEDKPVEVNLTVSTVSEYEENESSKSSDNFEVDTKPISAVSALIGRFEHIAKVNATEAANSRTSSRTSSRVSSPLSSPPSSWPRGTGIETVVESNKAIKNCEGSVHVESKNEDELTAAEVDQEVSEVEKTAKIAESVDASFEFEETLAENDVCEKATTLNEAVAHEITLAATDIDGAAIESFVVEETFVAIDAEESTLEVEVSNEKCDAIVEAPVAEVGVVEQQSIDESNDAEVEVEKTLAVEIELVEIIAEPEAEDVDLEPSIKEETPGTIERADAIALVATETYGAVEEVPVDMAEADFDFEASEPQTILAVYKPAEASILSVDAPEVDAAWNEADENVQEDAKDAAPSATPLVDMEEAATSADFTTDEALDNIVPVTKHIEEVSSDFVKETQDMYVEITESQVEGGKQEEISQSMEREMTSPPAPGVQTDDGALAYELTTKASVVTAPSNEGTKAVNDDAMETEGTLQRNSLQIPYDQLTYEILGVTRANNVIMYHIYAINHATGEQAMSIPKRYSEFKLLDEQLRALDLPSARGLPVLPKPGVVSFLRGRRSQKTIEMREKAFGDFLHYVRDHEDLHKSTVFQQFLAN